LVRQGFINSVKRKGGGFFSKAINRILHLRIESHILKVLTL